MKTVDNPLSIWDMPNFTASNGSVIENAIVGLKNYNVKTNQNLGGHIYCEDLVFKNCRRSVDLIGGTAASINGQTVKANDPTFNNCIFRFDDDNTAPNYKLLGLPTIFDRFALLSNLRGRADLKIVLLNIN